jgi:hypothetical protein
MEITKVKLYQNALDADHAWSKALAARFGIHAGDARYDSRGTSSPELKTLYAAYRTANDAWLEAMRQSQNQR